VKSVVIDLRNNLVEFLRTFGAFQLFFLRLLKDSPAILTTRTSLVIKQVHNTGAQSLVIIMVCGLFVGAVLALQAYSNMSKFNAEDWTGVESAARRALSIDPSLSLAWNYLGGALYNQGQAVAALDAWQKSVDHDPTNFDAMFNIAVVAGSIGDRGRARAALERFVREAPSASYGPDIQRARAWLAEIGG